MANMPPVGRVESHENFFCVQGEMGGAVFSSIQGNTILVVDDDAEIREVLATTLMEEGYPVRTAINGRDALRVLDQMEPPAVILLDLTMPVMDGISFMEQLEKRESRIPIVIVSAVGYRATQHTGPVVVDKPIDLDRLLECVRSYCTPTS